MSDVIISLILSVIVVVVFDCFDTFSSQSNVSFGFLISLKMFLIVIYDRCENKDEWESKQTKKDDRGTHQQMSKL